MTGAGDRRSHGTPELKRLAAALQLVLVIAAGACRSDPEPPPQARDATGRSGQPASGLEPPGSDGETEAGGPVRSPAANPVR